jgi:hypothetical protein
VKKTLCAIAMVASLFAVSAMAKTKNTAVPTLVKSQGPVKKLPIMKPALTPPSYCAPVCLFYGGDTNPNSPDDNGFANDNTLLVPDTTTWGAFTVPAGQSWSVRGLFINTIADGYNGLDPAASDWAIASGLSEGNGGSIVASGNATASFNPTGRLPFGFTEYTMGVSIPTTVLSAGTYWVNILPNCTNASNGDCSIAQYYFDDTFGLNRYGPLEPANVGFFNSSFFGFDYANLCEVSSTGCQALSFGVIGVGHSTGK